MLYTEDFTMCHYVGFSQIGSQICYHWKKCLAIKLGVEAFQVYLLGNEFTIQTDHRALQWLTKFKGSNNRLLWWSLALQPFWFQVLHSKGWDNVNAYSLSRQIEWKNNLRPKKGEEVWQKDRGRGHLDWTDINYVYCFCT